MPSLQYCMSNSDLISDIQILQTLTLFIVCVLDCRLCCLVSVVCVYPYIRCVFVVLALLAYWIAVRMHILSLAVILFSLSHMRPQLPGWEHDDIIFLIFFSHLLLQTVGNW